MSLTNCWSWNEIAFQKNVQCHSLSVGQTRYDKSAVEKEVQCHILPVGHRRCEIAFQKNIQCHSPHADHGQECDETAFRKMYNVIYILLLTGQDVRKFAFQKNV